MARRERPQPVVAVPRRRFAPPDLHALAAALALVLLLLAVAGLALAFVYARDPATAHAAMRVVQDGPLRWARSAHAWAASAALVLAALFLARAWASQRLRAMGRRRAAGVAAGVLVLLLAYATGTVLPWDQRGWEAFQHAQDGAALAGVTLGARDEPSSAPLEATFWIHVLALPVALVAALALHHGARRHVRDALARHARFAFGVLSGVLLLAAAFPPSLGPAPIRLLQVSLPHWPFLWAVPLQDRFGAAGLLAFPLAAALLVAAVLAPPPRRRGLALAVVALVFGWLTLLGAR